MTIKKEEKIVWPNIMVHLTSMEISNLKCACVHVATLLGEDKHMSTIQPP
ncbi:short-chain dehydrogenase [Sesbania bispinosa]|nr:short-chain dehydrogenase [Sesbania bispinosa]